MKAMEEQRIKQDLLEVARFAFNPDTLWELKLSEEPRLLQELHYMLEGIARGKGCRLYMMCGHAKVSGEFIMSGVATLSGEGRAEPQIIKLPRDLLRALIKAMKFEFHGREIMKHGSKAFKELQRSMANS